MTKNALKASMPNGKDYEGKESVESSLRAARSARIAQVVGTKSTVPLELTVLPGSREGLRGWQRL